MNTNAGTDLCRVTIVGPSRRVDLALPVVVTLAEVLPHVVRHAGEAAQSPDDAHAGWVLQRLGAAPLDATRRLSTLELRDGELLYLRRREDAAPELAFDDLVDAVATSAGFQAPWTALATRRTSAGVGLAALAVATVLLVASGPPWTVPAAALLGLSVATALVAGVVSRVVGNGPLGAAVGLAAVAIAAAGGAVLPGAVGGLGDLGAAHLLAAGAATAALATLVGVTVGTSGHAFTVLATLGTISAAAAAARLFVTSDPSNVAAVTLAVALVTTPAVPAIGFRVARLRLPLLPRGVVDLSADDELPAPDVLSQGTTAARVVRDLLLVTALVTVGCAVILAADPGWAGPTLATVGGVALLLRARLFAALTARLALLLGGTAAVAVVGLALFADTDLSTGLLAAGACTAVAAGFVAYAGRRKDRRPSPWLGRMADILEALIVLAVIPLVLAVLDLYAWTRGLAG